jgi:hypothetical protein
VSATGATSIANNSVFSLAAGLNVSASGVTMQGNSFVSTTTPITSGGAGNTIINNPGYNPVGVAALTPTASPWTYTAGASPETVYVASTAAITSLALKGVNVLPTNIAANTLFPVDLSPNETMVVTTTGTLGANKFVY